METHSCITTHQNRITFGVEDYFDMLIFCLRWLYLCDFFYCQNKVCSLCVVATYEWLWERKRWQCSSVIFQWYVWNLWIQNCTNTVFYLCVTSQVLDVWKQKQFYATRTISNEICHFESYILSLKPHSNTQIIFVSNVCSDLIHEPDTQS
jgi:hypothetical protein